MPFHVYIMIAGDMCAYVGVCQTLACDAERMSFPSK